MKYKILIVDDEEDIREILAFNLEKEGCVVAQAKDGLEALHIIENFYPDIILLDLSMPVMDGFECCRKIRENRAFDNIRILVLTARGDEDTHIRALELGGDDFVSKPVAIKVLISRIKALVRRNLSPLNEDDESPTIDFGTLSINPIKMEVKHFSETPELARKEFLLLYLLASEPGRVFRREEILDQIWGKDVIVGDRTIDVHIRKLREKLADSYIKTVKGVGYKFEL